MLCKYCQWVAYSHRALLSKGVAFFGGGGGSWGAPPPFVRLCIFLNEQHIIFRWRKQANLKIQLNVIFLFNILAPKPTV